VLAREDIETFLDRLAIEGTTYKEIEAGLWIVRPSGEIDLEVVVSHSPPVVVLRVKVMQLPTEPAALAKLSRQLLEWNANDLLHGSYGIQDDAIVLTEALELGHLDFEEFAAAYESMTLALTGHLRELATYRQEH
jgi:hypothetical protein